MSLAAVLLHFEKVAPVARFFFHHCNGRDTLADPDGRLVPDLHAIAVIALREARWLISQEALQGNIELTQSIEVRDTRGAIVHTLQFRDAVSVGDRT